MDHPKPRSKRAAAQAPEGPTPALRAWLPPLEMGLYAGLAAAAACAWVVPRAPFIGLALLILSTFAFCNLLARD